VYDFTGSPGRNRNHIENTRNFSYFVTSVYADTPKSTPSKRWLLADAVGCQCMSVQLPFVHRFSVEAILHVRGSTTTSSLATNCERMTRKPAPPGKTRISDVSAMRV
jgi:hypothetical protein